MARGEGEIDGARDEPEQPTEQVFIDYQTANVLPFSARNGTQVGGEGSSPRPHLSDPLGMSALVIELERSIAAAAQGAVAKPEARPQARSEATPIPEPVT